jgi:signal transduction histidine kinase
VRQTYDRFAGVVTQVVDLIRAGKIAEAREMQLAEAGPLADRLERLTNQLVNRAEVDMVAGITTSQKSHATSQTVVIAFVCGSVALALVLGYAISWSLIGPVTEIEARLRQIAGGDFSQRVHVANRDELGALAAGVNRTCEELGRLYDQLQAASRHKSEFLANTSHELRTPLNAMIGYAEMLMGKGGIGVVPSRPEQRHDYAEIIHQSGHHMLGVVNTLLDLSTIEAGHYDLSPEPIEVAALVEECCRCMSLTADRGGVVLARDVAPGLPEITVDRRACQQILLNLLSNAAKFTNAREGLPGRVDVACAVETAGDGRRVVIRVRDSGVGIPADKLEAVFEPFVQVDARLTRPHGGTGLGLAISRDLARGMGGEITVESAVGEGSTFLLTLPGA